MNTIFQIAEWSALGSITIGMIVIFVTTFENRPTAKRRGIPIGMGGFGLALLIVMLVTVALVDF